MWSELIVLSAGGIGDGRRLAYIQADSAVIDYAAEE